MPNGIAAGEKVAAVEKAGPAASENTVPAVHPPNPLRQGTSKNLM